MLKCTARYNNNNAATASIKYWFHPGYDKVYFRWYVKFSQDYDQGWGMHFCSLYAVQGDNKYNEMGKAGIKPNGDDRFGSGFEPWSQWQTVTPPGRMQFYTYWHQMAPDIYDDNGDGIPDVHYWGNTFYPQTALIPVRGQWYCMEIMIQANDAGQDNGQMAAWINGRLYMHLKEFNFRTTDALKLKRISLGIYIHNNPKDNVAWFDDVALSTGYIGPGAVSPGSADVTGDGRIDICDLQACTNHLLGHQVWANRADVDTDGDVDEDDIDHLVDALLGR